jgi:hypothetical protein
MTSRMQAGYNPAVDTVLGTPLEPVLREALAAPGNPTALRCAAANAHEAKVLAAVWDDPTLSVNSRKAAFAKQPTVLCGMTLTNPPNGGFGTAARSVIVGAGPGGAEYNTRLSCGEGAYFLQPGYPGKIVEVGPVDAVTVSPLAPPFRTSDGKARNARGAMSVARVDAEAAATAAAAAARRDALDPPVGPEPGLGAPAPPGLVSHVVVPQEGAGAHAGGAPATGSPPATSAAMRALIAAAESGSLGPCPPPPPVSVWGAISSALNTWYDTIKANPSAFGSPSTWTTEDVWVCFVIMALLLVMVILLIYAIVVGATKK